ncbi:MAG: gamma-glutamylcyclotransferase [Bacteroidota bacterium]|nr:gamma-glutamylcyclotransferase [Bacteroidota bacterium]
MNAMYHLFVYGSLRSDFPSEAHQQYIGRYFSRVGNGKIKGVLYDMGEYPAALPATGDRFIKGELYVIQNEDAFEWAIEQLDDYEGLHVEVGETALYTRELTEVLLDDTGEKKMAWVYWYNQEVGHKPHIASGDVMEYLQSKLKQG